MYAPKHQLDRVPPRGSHRPSGHGHLLTLLANELCCATPSVGPSVTKARVVGNLCLDDSGCPELLQPRHQLARMGTIRPPPGGPGAPLHGLFWLSRSKPENKTTLGGAWRRLAALGSMNHKDVKTSNPISLWDVVAGGGPREMARCSCLQRSVHRPSFIVPSTGGRGPWGLPTPARTTSDSGL